MTKSVGASMIETGYLYSLSISLEDVSYLQKENLLVLHWSNLADSILKLSSLVMSLVTSISRAFWYNVLIRTQYHFHGILTKSAQHKLNHKKISDKPKLRDSLQNWKISFNSVTVMKDKKRLRDSSRLKETKETWQLNVTSDPGAEKEH